MISVKELLRLFITFAKIGSITFGGGYAMLPILQREIVDKNKWCTETDLMDYYAIGQCTPGIIAVNTATFIGYKLRGIIGGIVATLGIIFPSLVIITVIAAFIRGFADMEAVAHALNGIRICVCALILDATIKLGKKSVIDKYCLAVFLIVFFVSLLTDVSTILLILVAGIAGIVVNIVRSRRAGAR